MHSGARAVADMSKHQLAYVTLLLHALRTHLLLMLLLLLPFRAAFASLKRLTSRHSFFVCRLPQLHGGV